MRDLSIAYGNNRQAKKWVNKTTKYTDLKERLKVTIRTTESAEKYAKMSKAQRDAAKDHGGFVGGVLAGGRCGCYSSKRCLVQKGRHFTGTT